MRNWWRNPVTGRDEYEPWPGEIERLAERGSVEETVFWQDETEGGKFNFGTEQDGSLDAVIGGLTEIREMVPEEFRAAARCKIYAISGYEDFHYASIKVTYLRPETDTEWTERKADVERRQQYAEARARAAYEAMKAKYEPDH